MANPLPATVTELMVSVAAPEELKVNVLVEEVLTTTLPKLSAPGLADSCGVAGVVAVPLRRTVVEMPVDESLEMVMAPVAAPATDGVKVTWSAID